MSSNNNFNETFLTKQGEDVTFGEDSTDLLVVNSNAEFTDKLTVSGDTNISGNLSLTNDLNVAGDLDIQGQGKIKGDVVIGEDSTDYLTVNSETRFLSDVNIGGSSIKLRSTDDTNANNFIEIMGERLHSTHVKTIRSINNNKIDGDLTIGEDDSEMLTIASKLHIPGGLTGEVLTKRADGSVQLATKSVVGFFVQPTATVTGTYGTDGAGADYSLSSVNKAYPLQQWTIKGYGGYYMDNSNPRFGFNSGHFDCTSNSGGKFTAPSNGNYYISFNIEVTTITGWYHTIGIYINGNPADGGTVLPSYGSGDGAYGFSYSKHHIGGINADPDILNTDFHKPKNYTESFIVNLQQNDYVQLVVYSRNDNTYIIGKSSYFCIYKM